MEDLIKDKEYLKTVEKLYRIGNGELLVKLVKRLQKQDQIPKHLELEDILEGDIEEQDKKTVLEETTRILAKRKALGYGIITGYHTSTNEYEVCDKIPLDTEGKAYFSDVDALYSAKGRKSMSYVYKVSAEGISSDVRDGWYYSRTPLVVLEKWTIEDFIKKHREANFR